MKIADLRAQLVAQYGENNVKQEPIRIDNNSE